MTKPKPKQHNILFYNPTEQLFQAEDLETSTVRPATHHEIYEAIERRYCMTFVTRNEARNEALGIDELPMCLWYPDESCNREDENGIKCCVNCQLFIRWEADHVHG
jgi:hypothetical protein